MRVGSEFQADLAVLESGAPVQTELVWDCTRITDSPRLAALAEQCRAAFREKHSESGQFSEEAFLDNVARRGYDLDVVERDLDEVCGASADRDGAPWTEEETRAFEYVFLRVGADFRQISAFVRSKSVPQVMHRYFCWKRSKAYDAFIERETAFFEQKRRERREAREQRLKGAQDAKKPRKRRGTNPFLAMARQREEPESD